LKNRANIPNRDKCGADFCAKLAALIICYAIVLPTKQEKDHSFAERKDYTAALVQREFNVAGNMPT
jgi:hypothetical protein